MAKFQEAASIMGCQRPVSIGYGSALEICLNAVSSPAQAEEVPLLDALGRILREDVVSTRSLPPFAKAVMDGYAVRRADIAGARPETPVPLRVAGEMPAGCRERRRLHPGESMRIMTGAPVPRGADMVVPMEAARPAGSRVFIPNAIQDNPFILPEGQDVMAGETLLKAGIRIEPPHMGLLAACGRASVRVSASPSVGILSTGSELTPLETDARAGQVYDINGHTLAGMVRSAGGAPRLLGLVPDSLEGIAAALKNARGHELLIVSGGFSGGDHDTTREALQKAGVSPTPGEIRVMDGRGIYFGRRGHQLVFGLPGNPVSTVMNFKLLILPVIDRMMGKLRVGMASGYARALNSRLLKPGGQRLLRGRLDLTGESPGVWVLAHQRSGMFHPLAEADVLLEVPEGEDFIRAGQRLAIHYLNEHPGRCFPAD